MIHLHTEASPLLCWWRVWSCLPLDEAVKCLGLVRASLRGSSLIFSLQRGVHGGAQPRPAAAAAAASGHGADLGLRFMMSRRGDQVDLCWSYHPEPPGHSALVVVTASKSITNLSSS